MAEEPLPARVDAPALALPEEFAGPPSFAAQAVKVSAAEANRAIGAPILEIFTGFPSCVRGAGGSINDARERSFTDGAARVNRR